MDVDVWQQLLAQFLPYLGMGGVAGVLSGLFGIGGGIVLVPFLIWTFAHLDVHSQLVTHMAIATSLGTIALTSMSAASTHQRLGAILWNVAAWLAPGVAVGSGIGALIASHLQGSLLQAIFGCFLLWVAQRLCRNPTKNGAPDVPAQPSRLIAQGTLIGALSSILGIGGGTLTVPLLVRNGYPMRNAVAISSVCGLPIALVGTASYAWLGWGKSGLPLHALGYVHLPALLAIVCTSTLTAPLGARLAHRIPDRPLRQAFALYTFATGVKLLWTLT